MPLQDTALVLATDIDVTASANGAAVTLGATGTLGPINNGTITMCHIRFDGAIETDSADELLDVFIEVYDGTTWYGIGRFPQFTHNTASKFSAARFASALRRTSIPLLVEFWATQMRYRTVVAGTIVTGWADMNLWLTPTNLVPDAA